MEAEVALGVRSHVPGCLDHVLKWERVPRHRVPAMLSFIRHIEELPLGVVAVMSSDETIILLRQCCNL